MANLSKAWILCVAGFAVISAQAATRYIVRFGDKQTTRVQVTALANFGTVHHQLESLNGITLTVPDGLEEKFIEAMSHDPTVSSVLPDPKLRLPTQLGPLAPELRTQDFQTQQEIPWGIIEMNATGAWMKSQGEAVKTCVLDTGVDYLHPDLIGQVVGGLNLVNPKVGYMDHHGHGTHVAGTIAALNNGFGVVGIAPQAKILGVEVLDEDGVGQWSDIVFGMEWCMKNGARIMNLSLGAEEGDDPNMKDAVTRLTAMGAIIVAAAGNNHKAWLDYPAAYPEVISVSASTEYGLLWKHSNWGPTVSFIAPGEIIMSTVLRPDYWGFDGTSMAVPHVVGAAALLLAIHPEYTTDQVKQTLAAAATKLKRVVPSKAQGNGLIDAGKLISL
jgi:subtilisin